MKKKEETVLTEPKKTKNQTGSSESKLSTLNNIIDSEISTIKKKK